MNRIEKENEILKEQIIVIKNYANVLKKKVTIYKDSLDRSLKYNDVLKLKVKRLEKELRKYEQ